MTTTHWMCGCFLVAAFVPAGCAQVAPADRFASEHANDDADVVPADSDVVQSDADAVILDVLDGGSDGQDTLLDQQGADTDAPDAVQDTPDAAEDAPDTSADQQDSGADVLDADPAATTDATLDQSDSDADGGTDPCLTLNCDDSNICTTDSCASGNCVHLANTVTCADGSACTVGDACAAKSCVPGQALACNDDVTCTTDTCDPAEGCVFSTNSVACDDGDPCTSGDACGGGACAGKAVKCAPLDQCHLAGTCSGGTCSNPLAPDSTPCDDGDACSVGENCVGGVCLPGGALSCDDKNPCTADACGAKLGCTHGAAANGTACDDGNNCTGSGSCKDGICAAAAIDADGDGYGPVPCGDDCNDAAADIHPGAAELCGDGIDNNCDSSTDDSTCSCPVYFVPVEVASGKACAADAPVWGNRPVNPNSLFVDNGDGTVTDKDTQLVWQKATAAQTYTWPEAASYCKSQSTAGVTGWRLPTVGELVTLHDPTTQTPAIAAPFVASTYSGSYWTALHIAGTSFSAWYVDFEYGLSGYGGGLDKHSVRCVSGDYTLPASPRFVVSGTSGVVLDSWTQLTWQPYASGDHQWTDAASYCTSLPLDGGGWRLPSVHELMGLPDRSKSYPALDLNVFAGTVIQPMTWSSTKATVADSAWRVDFGWGGAGAVPLSTLHKVRCVRGAVCGDNKCETLEMLGICAADCAACEATDLDKDGVNACLDCDDGNALAHPGATELCDGGSVDNDCDGQTDEACTCPAGYVKSAISAGLVCAPDFPVWGIRPTSPDPAWFVDNGDGTVADSQSKLTWQKSDSGNSMTLSAANVYCKGLAVAGKADWRLPTVAELLSLADLDRWYPSIVQIFAAPVDSFWTSVSSLQFAGWYWMVGFDSSPYSAQQTTTARARCVRGGPAVMVGGRFVVDAAEGTVMDKATGLTWQRDVASTGGDDGKGGRSWFTAKTYCQSLGLAGGGWRLPDIVELRSLADRSSYQPAIDAVAFPGTPSALFWAATGYKGNASEAWNVYFGDGGGPSNNVGGLLPVRCVR